MKRISTAGWIALLSVLVAFVATLLAADWLWSLDASRTLQSLGSWLTMPMRIFTFLGDEQFYLAIIPLVYWCIHKELGADLGALLVLSSLINTALKSFIKHNRPFWEDPKLALGDATSYSTPSGHAQTSAALFGKVISFLSRSGLRVLWGALFGVLIALIALSRVYLGVHYPGDVMWGIAVGLGLVSLYNWLKPRLLPQMRLLPVGLHVLFALAAAAVIVGTTSVLLALPFGAAQRFSMLYLDAWGASLEDAATIAGLAAGFWIGLVVESRYVRFTVAGPFWQRTVRYLVGAAGLLGIWMGLRVVFPQEPLALGLGLRIVRYGLAMLWGILAWPWLFVRIGLGQRETRRAGAAPADYQGTPTIGPA